MTRKSFARLAVASALAAGTLAALLTAGGAVPQPQTGACCLTATTCIVTSRAGCINRGGTWYGPNLPCSANLCPVTPIGSDGN